MATQVRLAYRRHYWCNVPPPHAGLPGCSPLHLLHHRSLCFIIGMPNMSCILKLSRTNVLYAAHDTSFVYLGASAKLHRRKPKVLVVLHVISEICWPRDIYRYISALSQVGPIKIVCDC